MECVPESILIATEALGRSRIAVSLLPVSLGVGNVCVPIGVSWPGPGTGATGASPLFQFVSVVHKPSALVIQIAGTSRSFKYSIPPCATSTSQLAVPPPIALTCAVLEYCHTFQG